MLIDLQQPRVYIHTDSSLQQLHCSPAQEPELSKTECTKREADFIIVIITFLAYFAYYRSAPRIPSRIISLQSNHHKFTKPIWQMGKGWRLHSTLSKQNMVPFALTVEPGYEVPTSIKSYFYSRITALSLLAAPTCTLQVWCSKQDHSQVWKKDTFWIKRSESHFADSNKLLTQKNRDSVSVCSGSSPRQVYKYNCLDGEGGSLKKKKKTKIQKMNFLKWGGVWTGWIDGPRPAVWGSARLSARLCPWVTTTQHYRLYDKIRITKFVRISEQVYQDIELFVLFLSERSLIDKIMSLLEFLSHHEGTKKYQRKYYIFFLLLRDYFSCQRNLFADLLKQIHP